MANSIKAALLSGLVYPGLGQLTQKHYRRGVALIATATLSLVVIVKQLMEQMMLLQNEIVSSTDLSQIMNTSTKITAALDNNLFVGCEYLLLICWIVGIVDAFLTEKKS